MPRQFLRFGLVGALATLVHMLIGTILIHSGWSALAANPISFLIAFVVSFMGHYGFSFSDQSRDVATSLKRFALVAVSGFAVNEGILAFLIWSDKLPQITALLLSTSIAAIVTFVACRNWAFQKMTEDQNGFDDVTARAPDGINVPRCVCNNP